MADWITSSGDLTQTEMNNNATVIKDFLSSQGWNLDHIAAICGAAQIMSHINPSIYKCFNKTESIGILRQPTTLLKAWADSQSLDFTDGTVQLRYLIYQINNGLSWLIPSVEYCPEEYLKETEAGIEYCNYTFSNWLANTTECAELLGHFLLYYYNIAEDVIYNPDGFLYQYDEIAYYWLGYLQGKQNTFINIELYDCAEPEVKKGMPVYMMCRKRGNQWIQ